MRVLIADDEPLAREGICLLLETEKDVEVIAVCQDGPDAVRQILSFKPDLVFLDINMPGLTGFEVVEQVGPANMPGVIFLTAYDEYAIEAFSINALDYLLKPVTDERFAESLNRARAEIKGKDSTTQEEQLTELLAQLSDQNNKSLNAERIMIRSSGHVFFLKPEQIIWVEAEGDYITIHTTERSHLVRETMKNIEGKLSGQGFQRIHRSSLVNLESIRELVINDNGDYSVVLHNDRTLRLSRSYRDVLCSRLQADV